MSEKYSDYHQNIVNWRKTFKKLPRAAVLASFLFMLIGILGFIAGLVFFSDKPVAYWILLIMGFASGVWFIIMRSKLIRMQKTLSDLNLLTEAEVFEKVIEKIVEIRKDKEIKDKVRNIDEWYEESNIKSKELHLELNRIAIEIQRNRAHED